MLAPHDITRVLLNLFGNGFYAANKRAHGNGDTRFHPVLRVATRGAGDAVEIKVRDNGIGIPHEIRDKLFKPFFTTKPAGEGTGLGLSISYDIVTQQHGGTITVDSEVGAFTEFTVRLPRRPQIATTVARRDETDIAGLSAGLFSNRSRMTASGASRDSGRFDVGGLQWVEPRGSIAAPRMAGIGA